jgi:parvulin-like peptidyl-prolyl isomerase
MKIRGCASLLAISLAAAAGLLPPRSVPAEEGSPLSLDNEPVCRVNTDMISKRDVEDRMQPPGVASMLRAKKAEWERARLWNDENQKAWYEAYIPPFREALRQIVRERLILQASKSEKINVDEKEYEREYEGQIKRLRDLNLLGSKGFTAAEVAKAVRENLTIATYESKFSGLLEQPTRPEVQKFYKDNLPRFQRKAGVMVRIIRIDRIVTNNLTKQQSVREDAYERAQEIYQNVHDYGADFKEVARMKSDDTETRERGGLLLPDPKDPFFDLDSCNPNLAKAIRTLAHGETVTPVFEYLNSSWAIVQVVDRREAGPEPIEGPLYDKIFKELMRSKSSKKADEWFKKEIVANLITRLDSDKGVWTPMGVDFFFPDDAKTEKDKVGVK